MSTWPGVKTSAGTCAHGATTNRCVAALFAQRARCWADREPSPLQMSIPTHCLAAGAVAVGATVTATQLHSNSSIPKSCIASAVAGSATVATVLAHHGSLTRTPAWYCVAGGAAGVAGCGYALSAHAELSKVVVLCVGWGCAVRALLRADYLHSLLLRRSPSLASSTPRPPSLSSWRALPCWVRSDATHLRSWSVREGACCGTPVRSKATEVCRCRYGRRRRLGTRGLSRASSADRCSGAAPMRHQLA